MDQESSLKQSLYQYKFKRFNSSSGVRKIRLPKQESLKFRIYNVKNFVCNQLFHLAIIIGLIMTLVSLHNLYPVEDPIGGIGIIDKLSLLIGVHENSAVIILDLGLSSTTIYVYIFHRHISDGSFKISSQFKKTLFPGVFSIHSFDKDEIIKRTQEVVKTALNLTPNSILLSVNPSIQSPPVLAKISPQILKAMNRTIMDESLQIFSNILESHHQISYNPKSSLGTLKSSDETLLQWFSINLLLHKLRNYQPNLSAPIVDVGDNDLFITMALGSRQRPFFANSQIVKVQKFKAFGHLVKLITLKFQHLGLLEARYGILEQGTKVTNTSENIIHSECINPIIEAYWDWQKINYKILGKISPDFELVRERNGPFAGKKVNRPVASYDSCHQQAHNYLINHTTQNITILLKNLLKGRDIFIEGQLLEKAMERGLTQPYRGGDVKMKSFILSLSHACKVPNFDQPFACLDLMYLATLSDKFLGLRKNSNLRSSCNIDGMTGEWPLAAAFYIYENGL